MHRGVPADPRESFATSPDVTCLALCFSVQQGTVRDSGVQIPWEARWLRLGRDAGHPDPLHETAEATVRRLRELHSKVGSHQSISRRSRPSA